MAESVNFESRSLQDLFKEGWDCQKKIDSDDLSSTSDEFKVCVERGVQCLEQGTLLANRLGLFSTNESMDDLATVDIKYLLMPALLGDLTLQLPPSENTNRLDIIQKSRIYFVDYLQRCKSYAITSEDPPVREDHSSSASGPAPSASKKTYDQLAAERTARIARLKERKETEKNLKELTVRVELSLVSQRHQVDEETVRKQALTLLRFWVFKAQDLVRSIDQELDMLEAMKKRGAVNGMEATPPDPPKLIKPVKPIVITKEMLQSKVFGAGYPSLPLMSVEEFYQQRYQEEMEQRRAEEEEAAMFQTRVADESMVGGGRGRKGEETTGEEGEEMEEDKDEDESEEALKKARDWDEFKDENRTGWGNKKNMG